MLLEHFYKILNIVLVYKHDFFMFLILTIILYSTIVTRNAIKNDLQKIRYTGVNLYYILLRENILHCNSSTILYNIIELFILF